MTTCRHCGHDSSDMWSDITRNGHRMTWREVAEERAKELRDATRFRALVFDLDRCEHGRHSGDPCFACTGRGTGPSNGNQFAPPGARIGTTIDGDPITVPDGRFDRHDVTKWKPGR